MKSSGQRIRLGLLACGLLMLLTGLLREENRIVLMKAVNICLECIGIG